MPAASERPASHSRRQAPYPSTSSASAMNNETITLLLARVANELSSPNLVFPVFFDVTLRVQRLTRDPDVSLDKIATLIATEPLLSAKIMRLANSAAMGGASGAVKNLRAAILRIGLAQVRSVAYAVSLEQMMLSKQMAQFKDISENIWRHSLAVAEIARLLAPDARVNPDEAFFMGMTHEIGAFYLLYRCAEDGVYAGDRDELLELILEWHDDVGHALLSALGETSEEILEAIRKHHEPDMPNILRGYTSLMSVANRLGEVLADWLPVKMRMTHIYPMPDIPSDDRQQEVMRQAEKEMEIIRAMLF